jgi:dTDP-4-dehydrorhamnose reductase
MLGADLMEVFSPGNEVVGLDLPQIDITDPEQCLATVGKFQPDVILNAAAYTRVDDCETNPDKAFSVNGDGPGNLARAADKRNALLVHYSTDYVFDGQKEEPYLEEDSPNPQSVYGKSKLLGEDFVRRICRSHLILRTSWLFGRNGANFIRTIVGVAQKGAPLRVVNDQRGSPTYSRDLAAHTLKMIQARCRATYHVTNSGFCTWFELASHVVAWAGIQDLSIQPVTTAEFQRPAPRPANSVLANTHLERDGLPAMRSWKAAAKEYFENDFGHRKSQLQMEH